VNGLGIQFDNEIAEFGFPDDQAMGAFTGYVAAELVAHQVRGGGHIQAGELDLDTDTAGGSVFRLRHRRLDRNLMPPGGIIGEYVGGNISHDAMAFRRRRRARPWTLSFEIGIARPDFNPGGVLAPPARLRKGWTGYRKSAN